MSTDQLPNAEPTAPPPPNPADRRRLIRRVVLLVLLGGVLVALGALAVIRWTGGNPGPDVEAEIKPSTGAVQFLQAVADGDAGAALALRQQAADDRTLLTDEVLARSRQLAPISRIEVVVDTPQLVELSYLLGDQEVHAQFTPVRQPDGSYKVDRGTTTVQLSRPRQVGVFINGVPVTASEVQAFPGTYELTTGMANIEYIEPRFTVSGPETRPQLAPSPRLSAQGMQAFLAAIRNRLAVCMESTEISPPGCPQSLDIADGTSVDSASVQWSLEDDPLAAVSPKLGLTDETVAEVRLRVHARLRAIVMTPTGPGWVNQSVTFTRVATGRVASDPITIQFVAS